MSREIDELAKEISERAIKALEENFEITPKKPAVQCKPRYIEADALIKELERYDDYAIDIVNDQQPADVRENVHGRWIFKNDNIAIPTGYYECSICGEGKLMNKENFCPNCGAVMDERSEDE